jgi:hypothetical protein
LDRADGFLAFRCFDHPMAGLLQKSFQQSSDLRFIVNDEDRGHRIPFLCSQLGDARTLRFPQAHPCVQAVV